MPEMYCCDEMSARRIDQVQAMAMPEGIDLSKFEASAFDTTYTRMGEIPAMAQMVGDIAVLKISGMLTNGNATWRRLFGMIGYEEIKAAAVETISRPDVAGVLIYYDTPGGMVNGVKGTAELLNQMQRIKPTVGYAAQAASAGYWMASSTGKLFADDLSVIGSLGSIMTIEDRTKQNEMEGVKKTVVKSGALKMAGNPNEETSPEVLAYYQMMIEDMTAVFYKSVAGYRGQKMTKLREDFGDGRAVLGHRALAGGLIDGLGGVNAAMRELASQVATVRKSKKK